MANYLVATLIERTQAEKAYHALEEVGLPTQQTYLLGSGHRQLGDLDLFDPNQAAWNQVQRMIFWLIPFGFFAGFTFNAVTQLTIWENLDSLGNHLLGGVFGAVAGAMGGFVAGGGGQLLLDKEQVPFGRRLQAGKYLLVFQGSELQIRQASRTLQSLRPESVQIYEADDRPPPPSLP